MPIHLFASRTFSVANVLTLLVYGALGSMLFFLVLQLQVVTGWTPLKAGLATVPLTLVMLLLSSRSGALAARIGPRLPLTVGPVLCGLGALVLRGIDAGTGYFTGVLPGVLVFSCGLVLLVAPLTSSVLAAAPDRYAGIASGINNAVARTGSLLAVSALPAVVGIAGADYRDPAVFAAGYAQAQLICAVLLFAGGAISFVGLRDAAPRARLRRGSPAIHLTATERLGYCSGTERASPVLEEIPMYALLTLDVARDAVADQFTYGEPLSTVVRPEEHAPRAPRTRSLLSGALHRVADLLAPADYSPAH